MYLKILIYTYNKNIYFISVNLYYIVHLYIIVQICKKDIKINKLGKKIFRFNEL